MNHQAILYIRTALLTAVVCLPLHYLASIDWPWAIALGLIASIGVRAAVHRREIPR